jgi:hypothetical protein
VNDLIIEAINCSQLNRSNISFGAIRTIAGRNYEIQQTLGYGRSIIETCQQLDQYLYSYGPMTKAQWDAFLPNVSLPNGNLNLIDYGCGQGLGSVILFDYFGPSLTERIKQVRLIEPSAVALLRAKEVIDCYLHAHQAVTLNKRLDEIAAEDLNANGLLPQVHILSNVLDIDGFDHGQLFSKILQSVGRHAVLAVSHDRDFHGGSNRFEQLDNAIKDPKHSKQFKIQSSSICRFTCGTNKPAISWELHIEVLNGFI